MKLNNTEKTDLIINLIIKAQSEGNETDIIHLKGLLALEIERSKERSLAIKRHIEKIAFIVTP